MSKKILIKRLNAAIKFCAFDLTVHLDVRSNSREGKKVVFSMHYRFLRVTSKITYRNM
jgi:hypothetical protein